ncbi:hypothetical protein O9992_17440 [Vibrio lentus]|nr:hypothetical protein [Vibrio lentus]
MTLQARVLKLLIIEAGSGLSIETYLPLPPMMFSTEELEALRLGAEWVAKQANGVCSGSARNAIAKISAAITCRPASANAVKMLCVLLPSLKSQSYPSNCRTSS